ncbi:hypothetical protein FD755_014133 [Muntiacus reevesi]|uniref:CCHC-type domain-containing protein n=1 Tax=Muntiacus reevesi TaxID=9886 RepID=A0A5N3XKX8_MUNRE|nr:hypothetical protein FD755_014133 [Muntiacus reevesi]
MNSGRPETMENLPALYTIFQGEVAKSQTMEPLSKFQAVGSKDLDPSDVINEQEERQRRSFQDYTGQRITLEAVLNTTCKKCGCKGYFAKDCFMQPGGTKYSPMRKRRRKRQSQNSSRKRKEKNKHRDRKSSDSDSSDSESDTGKRTRQTSKDSKSAKKKTKKKRPKE